MKAKVTSHAEEIKTAKNQAIAIALESIGITAEGFAKLKCPVDTGNLRNSISHATTDNAVIIGTNVEYAPYVEMGTSNMRAQPYLQPAVEEHMAQYKEIVLKALK